MQLSKPAHSSLGASSMHRWMNCPGSIRQSKGIESKSSSYAKEGTLAHEAGEILINLELDPHAKTETFNSFYDENEMYKYEDMIEAVEVYVRYILDEIHFKSKNSFLYLEHKFDLSEIYPGCFGTADCVSYDAKERVLHVVDYKHGAGIPVDVIGNPQLRYYALGALLSTNIPCVDVVITVVQPRCKHPDGPIRSETIPPMELIEFAADLKEYCVATEAEDAPLKSGSWCRFCPANHTCELIASNATEMAVKEFSVEEANTGLIAGRPIQEILAWLPTLEAWIKNVREFAYGEAVKGRAPEGYKLVEKRATRKWKDQEAQTVDYLTTMLGLDKSELYKQTLLTPPQVEKLLDKDQKKALAYAVVKKSSGTTLALESDKREAIMVDPASQFDKVE